MKEHREKLFGKALKYKNKKQEARGNNKLKGEGKSLDSRDGCLKQDKQERRRKLWTGKIRRGFELYTIYFFTDNE